MFSDSLWINITDKAIKALICLLWAFTTAVFVLNTPLLSVSGYTSKLMMRKLETSHLCASRTLHWTSKTAYLQLAFSKFNTLQYTCTMYIYVKWRLFMENNTNDSISIFFINNLEFFDILIFCKSPILEVNLVVRPMPIFDLFRFL